MNSEQLKHMEMENILSQGDMNSKIDRNTKEIIAAKGSIDDTNEKVVGV